MNVYRVVSILLISILLIAAGVGCIYAWFADSTARLEFGATVDAMIQDRAVVGPLGILLLIVGLLGLGCLLPERSSRQKIIAFTTENGPVEISRSAVRDYVIGVCGQIGGVRQVVKVDPQGFRKGKGGITHIHLALNPGAEWTTVSTVCQERVCNGLMKDLGFDKVGRVIPYLVELKSKPSSGSSGGGTLGSSSTSNTSSTSSSGPPPPSSGLGGYPQ